MSPQQRQAAKIVIGTALLVILPFLASCAERGAPDQFTVRKILVSYYAQQGYTLGAMEVGDIEGEPAAQKTYGRKRAYHVTVKSLTLEGKGPQLTLGQGVVTIRERWGAPGKWDIERMPPELAPR